MADTVEQQRPIEEKAADIGPHQTSEVDSEKAESEYKQEGVQAVEAITSAWTVKALWITFVLLWLVEFADSMLINTQYAVEPYVTSSFSQHGLLATTGIMSSIIAGVSKLTIAKIMDIWGRVEGYALVLVLLLMGLVMKAACQNVTTYAAAAVFYWVGHTGLGYTIDVFVSDMTTLRNRAIIYGLNYTPTIATTFAGPAAAQDFLEHSTWRWAFGSFCIIMPIISMPVFTSFFLNAQKAKKMGLVQPRNSGRTPMQSIKHYVIEFDVLGMLLTTAAFSLILLPFSLASGAQDRWGSGSIIAMLVIGVLCFIAFVVWEKYYAPVQYLPFRYLKDPTIGGSCLCGFTMFCSIFCWDAYLGSFLQVVNQLSVRDSGYIVNSFSLTSAVFMPLTGLAIRYIGRPKWIAMTAVPIATLGTGLLLAFRRPDQRAGYITMTQIFVGTSSGILASSLPVAIMAAVDHQHIAVVLALQGLFMSIGSSCGLAIAGAIWTNLLPGRIEQYLPDDLKAEALTIYGDITVQLAYEYGSPARDAIIRAYGDIMRLQVIAGVCFMPLMFVSILIWKNYNVKNMVQTKGTVF